MTRFGLSVSQADVRAPVGCAKVQAQSRQANSNERVLFVFINPGEIEN
jgi:hypothetical protein